MPHPASKSVPIVVVATALGMTLTGGKTHCFNGSAHAAGGDRNPSLHFQTSINRFKCYSCGVVGDPIDLVRGVLGGSFHEAVDRLIEIGAGQAAFTSPVGANAPSRAPTPSVKEVYVRLFELTYNLGPRSPGGRYLAGRGIDLKVAEGKRVTEMRDPDETWRELSLEFDETRLRAAGLLSKRGKFLFGGHRLLLFHFDDEWPQYVTARDITGKSSCKELSPAGLRCPLPYLSDALRTAPERILICEGCIDTLSATQLGHTAVGVPGVVGFRDEWFALFPGASRITVLFDDDDAGRRQGAELRARFRQRGFMADAAFPRIGKDVNDLLKTLVKGDSP